MNALDLERKFPIDVAEGYTEEEEAILRTHLQTIEDAISLGVLVEADRDSIYMVADGMPDNTALPLRKLDFADMMMNQPDLCETLAAIMQTARSQT